MLNPKNVLTEATKGIIKALAHLRGVSVQRVYEMLSDAQNPYDKSKDLISDIAEIDRDRARLIKADMDAFWAEILGDEHCFDLPKFSKEVFEAVQSVIEGRPSAEQIQQIREMLAEGEKAIAALKTGDLQREEARRTFENATRYFGLRKAG